jgi:hypothetical protein
MYSGHMCLCPAPSIINGFGAGFDEMPLQNSEATR